MALSIADLIQVGGRASIQALGRNYQFTEIRQSPNTAIYTCGLYDPVSLAAVQIAWSPNDDLHLQSERSRIDFVRNLIVNAVHSLDSIIADRQQPAGQAIYGGELKDVDFGE